MLQLSYLGIAFAAVFYVVFGITVRMMELSDQERNKARLAILITSLSMVTLSSLFAGLINVDRSRFALGVLFILIAIFAFSVLAAILFELHNIKTKIKMRRFMALFDIVDRFINEGKPARKFSTTSLLFRNSREKRLWTFWNSSRIRITTNFFPMLMQRSTKPSSLKE